MKGGERQMSLSLPQHQSLPKPEVVKHWAQSRPFPPSRLPHKEKKDLVWQWSGPGELGDEEVGQKLEYKKSK